MTSIKKIKTYSQFLNEGNEYENEDIKNFLDREYHVHNYIINPDLTVDVLGNVNIAIMGLKEIDIQFGEVRNFNCNRNQLTSLKGCPYFVDGKFFCNDNKLTSLEFCPSLIHGHFECSGNKLTSFVFASKPPYIYGGNPCSKIYYDLGFTTEAHVKSLLELDPDPADTLRRLEKRYPERCEDIIKNSRELRFISGGYENEEVQNSYNNSKTRGDDFY